MYKSTFVYNLCGFLSHQELWSLVAAFPSPGLAHGVETSVVLSSEARRCLVRALSGFCSAMLTPLTQACLSLFRLSNLDEVFRERDFSLVAVHKSPREVFCCTKDDVWSLAVLHPSRTVNRTTELQTRGTASMKFHICARI